MNLKRIGTEIVETYIRCISGISLAGREGGLRKITRNMSQGSRCPGTDSNRVPPRLKSQFIVYCCVSFIISPVFVHTVLRHA
jgi:hypothetical protein